MVFFLSLLLTVLAWYYVHGTVEDQNRVRFDEIVQATKATVDRRTEAYLDALFGARDVFLVSNADAREEEWESYVRGIDTKSRLEGLQALGFARYVKPDERKAFVREAREEGRPQMRPDLDPGGERSAYFPLTLVAPSDRANVNLINRDYYTDPAHRMAMDKARDSGSPRATRMVLVLTEAASYSSADLALSPGFAVYLPVYEGTKPVGTRAERRRALKGFIVGYFQRDGLFDDVFGSGFHPGIDFEVYDGADVGSSALLYDDDGVQHAGGEGYDPLFSHREKSEVAGRRWSLYFATLPGFEEEVQSNLPVFVLASGVGVSFLIFGITWMLVRSRSQAVRAGKNLEESNRELQRSRERLVSAREEERRRLRRDLHDGVGPQLAALMLELETASERLAGDPETSAFMAKLSDRSREIVADVRRSVHALRPPALDDLGLVAALREWAALYGRGGLSVLVENPGNLSDLPAAVEVACYRIAQEALANVVRHAGASNCSVRIQIDEEAGVVSVEVEDDGRGIREDDRAGIGMSSMRERTEELGGRCTVKPLAGGGTLVSAFLPFRTTGDANIRKE